MNDETRFRLEAVLERRDRQVTDETRRMIRESVRDRESLTKRELETLQCIADGMTNSQAAAHLFLSDETVKTYVRRILLKFETHSRAHAVAIGLRSGLIR